MTENAANQFPHSSSVALSESRVSKIAAPSEGRIEYTDSRVPELRLRVTARGAKTWRLQKRFRGKLLRPTIGSWPDISVEVARDLARQKLLDIQAPEVRRRRATLREARDEMLSARDYKPKTAAGYIYDTDKYCAELLDRQMREITRQDVLDTFKSITAQSRANSAFRAVRAIYNFWAAVHDIDLKNPVKVLSDTRAWHRQRRRQTVVHAHQLPVWWQTIEEQLTGRLGDPRAQAAGRYLRLLLLTGLRPEELAALGTKPLPARTTTTKARCV
ncbi:MAG: Arm DNA-binding domain-containing protein [Pseudomonadota bacterium]